MKLVWPRTAVHGRERQIDYIAERNPDAAARLEQRIIDATEQLIDHPYLGRAGRISGTRELVVARTPFVVNYEIEDDCVRIISCATHRAALAGDDLIVCYFGYTQFSDRTPGTRANARILRRSPPGSSGEVRISRRRNGACTG